MKLLLQSFIIHDGETASIVTLTKINSGNILLRSFYV
jgi:hypothetical protein